MTTLTLYYTPGTCAQAVRIALEEAGAPYDLVRVDFAAGQQRTPEYLAVNPKGRVPALATPHGTMRGTFMCMTQDAEAFEASVPEFGLTLASALH